MSRRKNKKLVTESLYLDIYLIGYKKKGESVVFIIYADSKINYVGVIDCYEVDDDNLTISILNELGIRNINFFCWTHPDEDHSLGIDRLMDFIDKDSKVYIPVGIDRVKNQLNDRIKSTLEKLYEIAAKKQNYSVEEIGHCQDLGTKVYEYFDTRTVNYKLNIKSLSPYTSICKKREISDANKIKLNDYSISFFIKLGSFNFLFAGDIENQTLTAIENKINDIDLPESFDYVKIPHHASESAEKIFGTIFTENTLNEIACTTTFNSGKTILPDKRIINLYKNCTKSVYCTDNKLHYTNKNQFNENKKNNDFLSELNLKEKGIIYCRFDIINDRFKTEADIYGDAIRV